jgi:hypothetical protein
MALFAGQFSAELPDQPPTKGVSKCWKWVTFPDIWHHKRQWVWLAEPQLQDGSCLGRWVRWRWLQRVRAPPLHGVQCSPSRVLGTPAGMQPGECTLQCAS